MEICKSCGAVVIKSDICGNGCVYCTGYDADEIDALIAKSKAKESK